MRLLLCPLIALALAGCAARDADSKDDKPAAQPLPPHESPKRAKDASPDDIKAVAAANNAFGLDLFRAIKEKGNLVYSPISVSTALNMTAAGARGQTATEMATVLRHPFASDRVHLGNAGLLGSLFETPVTGVRLQIANALWGRIDYPDDFAAITRDCYAAAPRNIDLVGAEPVINKWAKDHTAGKIKDLLKPGSLSPLTCVVLTNTVYFKGEWAKQFKKSETRDEDFHAPDGKAKVPTMRLKAKIAYGRFDTGKPSGFRAAELAYRGGQVSMVILLPDAGNGLAAVEKVLTPENLVRLGKLRPQEVRLRLPRFAIHGECISLNEPLQALGMKTAFVRSEADFSGMGLTRNGHIGEVVHKAMVQVNEEGTVAAAATAVRMNDDGKSPEDIPVDFVVDRPFLFAIRSASTGAMLFLGRVVKP